MVETYKISTIHDIVDIATSLPKSWFRGHYEVIGELIPKIFRKDYTERDYDVEKNLTLKFKLNAPSLRPNLPKSDDYLSWLFLMQHHGLPTRLLDWSESPLIALFFSVKEKRSCDGELWAMCPYLLNNCYGTPRISTADHKTTKFLAAEPFLTPTNEEMETIRYPIAIKPAMSFPRMVSQLSAFTIHPKPYPECTITELLGENEKALVRYIIPGDLKDELLLDLESLGITEYSLFQDLDSLSMTLERETIFDADNIPSPPRCGGDYIEINRD